MDLPQILQELQSAASVAQDYSAGGLQVELKTNYTPAMTLYNEAVPGQGNALARLIGLQGGLRVLDASGNVIAQFGDWPVTDPVRVAAALSVGALLGLGLIRLVRGRRRS